MYLNRLKFAEPINKYIQVVLASSSGLFLEGISSILKEESDIQISAKASSYEDLLICLAEMRPKFVFLDNKTLELDVYNFSNLISKKSPDTKLILLGPKAEDQIKCPNVIYLTKETNSKELIQVIKGTQAKNVKYLDNTKPNLTITETKIVELIGDGFGNKEIAKKLSISEKTVKAHLTNIYTKLGVQNRYQLIVYAKKLET
jgi:Response regulator containing a CheY-like receiver domain and an HTH DNA-binding domain